MAHIRAMADQERPKTAAKGKSLSPAALRALKEAEARRTKAAAERRAPEKGGSSGPEPTRYGDWEKGGKISDF